MNISNSDYVEVIPDYLFFGNVKFARNIEGLKAKKINTIINLIYSNKQDSQIKYNENDGFNVLYHPVKDTPKTGLSWAEQAAEFIQAALSKNNPVYVHCSQGVSRSTTLVLYYMMTRKNFNLKSAFDLVKAMRPIICPSIGFFKGLVDLDVKMNGSNTFTTEDFSLLCLRELSEEVSEEDSKEAYEKAKILVNSDKEVVTNLINRINNDDIEPIGYLAIDILIKKYSSVKERGHCSLHHPFD